ncbi:MAG: hypothetical protein WD468_12255 [Pirellulales bacterium]
MEIDNSVRPPLRDRASLPARFSRDSTRSMDLNRHQFLFIGLIFLLLGIQTRYVSAYVLNPKATQFLAEHTGQSSATTSSFFAASSVTGGGMRKTLQPPEWLSWCLISVGAVLVLHSLAMPKPS